MNKNKIEKLIKGGENQKMEFKSKINDGLGDSICSFANTNNGTILLGIGDNGKIIGIDKKYEEKIANIAHTCKPSIYPDVENIEIEDKNIFVIEVKKSDSLHSFGNIAYKRIASHDKPLSPEEVIEFAKDTGKIKWDGQICKETKLTDIDEGKVKWYLEKRAEKREIEISKTSFEQMMMNLGVLVREENAITNAGMLFFGKNPQKSIPYSEVKIARFKGTSMTEFIDRRELRGILPELIDEAEKFVKRNTRRATKIIGFEQVNITEYPYEAVREAITNAVCHRDYFFSGASVRIMIYDDRIVVESPGRLPEGVTLKNLEGSHALRNERVAGWLYDIGYIEKWGTGIRRMKDLMQRHGLQTPEFEENERFFRVTFLGPEEKILDLVKPKDRIDLKEKGLNRRQIEALKLIVNEETKLTNKQYRKLFNVSKPTATRDLTRLVKENLIREAGKGRSLGYIRTQ